MVEFITRRSLSAILCAARGLFGALILMAGPAHAETKNWWLRVEPSLESTTNLQQQAGGTPDWVLRNNVDFSYTPWSDADRSLLLRFQALSSRYQFNPDYDATFVSGTGLGSSRLWGNVYGYGGYQLLYKQGDRPGTVNRLDGDVFGGMVAYTPLNATSLFFHGYQADVLRAAVTDTSYLGHSWYATVRNLTLPAWINSLSVRSQMRMYDTIGELEWRNQVTLESVYRVTDWFNLVAEGFIVNSTASQPNYSFLGSNVGLFSRMIF